MIVCMRACSSSSSAVTTYTNVHIVYDFRIPNFHTNLKTKNTNPTFNNQLKMKSAVMATMVATATANIELFNKFKSEHGKTYETTIGKYIYIYFFPRTRELTHSLTQRKLIVTVCSREISR